MEIDEQTRAAILAQQRNEITEHHIYLKLAGMVKGDGNRQILGEVADEELAHYGIWRQYTREEVKPDRWKILKFYWVCRLFGFPFGLKLMERGEMAAQKVYGKLVRQIPEAHRILQEEQKHEQALLKILDEELLQYTGSMVLGLNDALVELTGALAGFTLALKNTKLIALVGLVTGIAAALSMASSEYLSLKSESSGRQPFKGAFYTGVAYLGTVIVLVSPYLFFSHYFVCLAMTMVLGVLIIFLFNLYISIARDMPFQRHFMEMTGLSFGVAALSFLIGYLLRLFMGVDV